MYYYEHYYGNISLGDSLHAAKTLFSVKNKKNVKNVFLMKFLFSLLSINIYAI